MLVCNCVWQRMAMTSIPIKETPALNALKALRGAPTSMGRGEIPVGGSQPPSVLSFLLVYENLQIQQCHRIILLVWYDAAVDIQKGGNYEYELWRKN